MTKFDMLHGTVMSDPIIEMESPFYLSFHVKVENDVVPATFIGDFARALRNNIRVGDKVIIREGLIDNGKLVFSFMHMEKEAAMGRNVNFYA